MIDIDCSSPPFDRFRSLHRLSAARSGHASWEHARHHLYVARDTQSRVNVLIKVTSRPGLVYENDLANEIATLTAINRQLPDSRAFPVLGDHGHLPDGRVFLTMSLFDEWPLATTIGAEPEAARQMADLRTVIEAAAALSELHGLRIWHVDLNPMNILCRWHLGTPVVRVVDFESSYETARHSRGVFYNPPTTSSYSAPELARQAPDARADLFSLGAVCYTMLTGYGWTWEGDVWSCICADTGLAPELKTVLLAAVDVDPAKRLPSMGDLRVALMEYVDACGGYHRGAKEH